MIDKKGNKGSRLNGLIDARSDCKGIANKGLVCNTIDSAVKTENIKDRIVTVKVTANVFEE